MSQVTLTPEQAKTSLHAYAQEQKVDLQNMIHTYNQSLVGSK